MGKQNFKQAKQVMTKEELSQIHWLNKEIAMWQQKLDRLESQSLVKGPQITGMLFGSNKTISKVEDRVVMIEEIRERMQNLKNRSEREQVRILEYIDGIEDCFIRQIVQYRFLELRSWKEVAVSMGGENTPESIRKAFQRFLKKQE